MTQGLLSESRLVISNMKWIKFTMITVNNAELEKTKRFVLPIVAEWKQKVETFEIENIQHKEMIKRFDQIICEKASRMDIKEIYSELTQYVKRSQFNTIFEFKEGIRIGVMEYIDLIHLKINEVKEGLTQELARMVFNKGNEVHREILEALGGKPIDRDELMLLLDVKVDKSDFN